jgi:hypothetical protein
MDIKDIQKLSKNFRIIASRLLNSGYRDSIDNLIRFTNCIDTDETISNFISKNNNAKFDVEKIIKEKGYSARYPAQYNKSDEIAFTYQLLKYASENCKDYFKISQGYSDSRKLQDHNDEFNKVVVKPFIDYILAYLDELYSDLKTDSNDKGINFHITGENKGLINVNQGGTSNISSTIINNPDVSEINELIQNILVVIECDKAFDNERDEITEILNEIKDQLASASPKKKYISLLIEKLSTIASVITIATTLSGPTKTLYDLVIKYLASI